LKTKKIQPVSINPQIPKYGWQRSSAVIGSQGKQNIWASKLMFSDYGIARF